MTWTRVAVYWGLFLSLFAYEVVAVRRRPAEPVAPAGFARMVALDANEIVAIELHRADRLRAFRRMDGEPWHAVAPGTEVPSDLVAALVTALASLQSVEVVATDAGHDAGFGLAPAYDELVLVGRGGRQVKIVTGALNPAGTAVYARVGDDPRIFLIGLDVRYYEDLLFAD